MPCSSTGTRRVQAASMTTLRTAAATGPQETERPGRASTVPALPRPGVTAAHTLCQELSTRTHPPRILGRAPAAWMSCGSRVEVGSDAWAGKAGRGQPTPPGEQVVRRQGSCSIASRLRPPGRRGCRCGGRHGNTGSHGPRGGAGGHAGNPRRTVGVRLVTCHGAETEIGGERRGWTHAGASGQPTVPLLFLF